jgi:WD40 repeat protein
MFSASTMKQTILVGILLLSLTPVVDAQQDDPTIRYFCDENTASLAWSPNGNTLAIQGGRGGVLFDRDLNLQGFLEEPIRPLLGDGGGRIDQDDNCWGVGVAWDPTGKQIAIPSYYQEYAPEGMGLRIWNAESLQPIETIPAPMYGLSMRALAWSADGRTIAMVLRGYGDGYAFERSWVISIWDTQANIFTRWSKSISSAVNSLDWHPDNLHLASTTEDGIVQVWDTSSSEMTGGNEADYLVNYQAHSRPINDIGWNPNGDLLATASDDASIRIWSYPSGELIRELVGHSGAVNAIDWSPDGTYLVSGSNDSTLKIWNIELGEVVVTLEGHTQGVHTLDWNSDGSLIASSSYDNSLRTWDALNYK